jgi:hypothetical protein
MPFHSPASPRPSRQRTQGSRVRLFSARSAQPEAFASCSKGAILLVKAAAAGMKVRFGSRFAVTGRRLGADRQVLRISAGLLVTADIANTSGYHLAHL